MIHIQDSLYIMSTHGSLYDKLHCHYILIHRQLIQLMKSFSRYSTLEIIQVREQIILNNVFTPYSPRIFSSRTFCLLFLHWLFALSKRNTSYWLKNTGVIANTSHYLVQIDIPKNNARPGEYILHFAALQLLKHTWTLNQLMQPEQSVHQIINTCH